MQVACSKCGATYAFDASAIPASGYDAQCTSCGGVFFVAPEPAEVSVTCTGCGAIYQFAATAIPAGGYDAQCTQCRAVFFVSPVSDEAALQQPLSEEPASRLVELEPVEEPGIALPEHAPEPVLLEPSAKTPAPTSLPLGTEPLQSNDEAADMLALADSMGEPAPASLDSPDEYETTLRRRGYTWLWVAALPLAVVALLGVLYFAAPTFFDNTVGRHLGMRHRPPSQAVVLVQQARVAFLDDTENGYRKAHELLAQALAIDSHYDDASATMALTHVFVAADARTKGQALYDEGSTLAALVAKGEATAKDDAAATDEAAAKTDAKAEAPDPAELQKSRARAKDLSTQASALFEVSGAEMGEALKVLKTALDNNPNSPALLIAAGVYYASDADGIPRARDLLHTSEAALGDAGVMRPVDPMAAYLKARLVQSEHDDGQARRAALEAVLAAEPKMQRARYELATLLAEAGKREEAERLVEEVLHAVPTHAKAKALLDELTRKDAAAAAVATDLPPTPAKLSKGKRRKGKRRR